MDDWNADEAVTLGYVSGVFGVRGWIKIHSYTDPRENILEYSPWRVCLDGQWRTYKLEDGRSQGRGLVAKLASVDDPDAARALAGAVIAVPAGRLPALPDGKFYWSELLGLRVVTLDGRELGQVTGLMETGANDVLVLGGKPDRLVPFLWERVVQRVDTAAGLIVVDWQDED